MSKQTKKIIIALVLLAVLALGAFLCWRAFAPAPVAGDKTLSVSVTHGDGAVKELEMQTDAEYLWDAMAEQGLIEGTDSQYGKWVTAVDGETADEAAGLYWMYTKGGEMVETSCDTTPIADGDHFEFYIYAYGA